MIDTFFTILRKIMFSFVFVVFGFVTVYAPVITVDDNYGNVEVAHAGGAFVDPVNLVQNTISAVQTTIQVVWDNWIYLKESVLDGIAWHVAKQLISTLVSDLVNWINTGINGGPAFVQNLRDYLLEQTDTTAGEFINEIGGSAFVCDPFRLDVQIAVAEQYDVIRDEQRPSTRSCTMTQDIQDFDLFIAGDKANSDWADWFNIVAQPDKTPYGSILRAESELNSRIIATEQEETTILDFGNGFLSNEICRQISGTTGTIDECFITTPGKIITEQLNKSLGIGLDQLVAADEFDEIITSLISQLANQAITGAAGLLGLSGGTGSTYTGYTRGSFVGDLADGVINGSGAGGNTNLTANPFNNVAFNSSRDLIVNALQTQSTVVPSVDTYIANLNSFINNPLNDAANIQIARVALSDAQNIRARIASDINAATPILNQYDALTTQFQTATPQQQIQIQQQQSNLIQQFSQLSLITSQEFSVYTSQWDNILATNVGPLVNPCNTQSGPFNPNCLGNFISP